MISHAQFCEDLILAGCLEGVEKGRYVDVGANHPVNESISYGFYEDGWSGLTIDPVGTYAPLHWKERPRDTHVTCAASSVDGQVALNIIDGTGLSTVNDDHAARHAASGYHPYSTLVNCYRLDTLLEEHWDGSPIHFVSIDVEGHEADVLAGFDLDRWKPQLLVIESTAPCTMDPTWEAWEPMVLSAGYTLFREEAVNRFYHR